MSEPVVTDVDGRSGLRSRSARLRGCAAAFAGLALAAGLIPQAAPPAAATTFNIPRTAGGSVAQSDVFNRLVEKEIRSTRPGDLVTVSTYGLSDFGVRQALIDVARAGVRIKVLSWSGDTFASMPLLMQEVGSDRDAASWAIKCAGSCARKGATGTHHLKVVTVSTTRRTIVASGNLTGTGDVKWNEFQTSYDPKVYLAFTDWVQALSADREVPSPASFTSGGWRLDFLPTRSKSFDPHRESIEAVSCTPYEVAGTTVRPVIRVGMMIWTDRRVAIATELGRKVKAGCDVLVFLVPAQTEPKVLQALRDGAVPMRLADGAIKMHAKNVTIDAENLHRVIAGSTNFGGYGTNTNVVLTMDSEPEVQQHLRWYGLIARTAPVWE